MTAAKELWIILVVATVSALSAAAVALLFLLVLGILVEPDEFGFSLVAGALIALPFIAIFLSPIALLGALALVAFSTREPNASSYQRAVITIGLACGALGVPLVQFFLATSVSKPLIWTICLLAGATSAAIGSRVSFSLRRSAACT